MGCNFQVVLKNTVLILIVGGFLYTATINGQINDSAVTKRIERLQYDLKKDQRANKIWWNSWLAAYSVGTVVQITSGIINEDIAWKQDMYLGGGLTALGVASLLISPVVKVDGDYYRSVDGLSFDEQKNLLKELESLYEASANWEEIGRSWQIHALTIGVNMVGGVVTWLVFDRTPLVGFVNFAINTVVTEAQIWTQPILAQKGWGKYNADFSVKEKDYFGSKAQLSLIAMPGRVSLRLSF